MGVWILQNIKKKKQEKTLNTSIQTSRQLKQKIPTYKRQLKPYHLTESNISDWRRFHVIIDYLPLYPIIAYWKSVKQKMYKCIISSPPFGQAGGNRPSKNSTWGEWMNSLWPEEGGGGGENKNLGDNFARGISNECNSQ